MKSRKGINAFFNSAHNLSVGFSSACCSDATAQKKALIRSPIPSAAVQAKVVRILDRFQELTLLEPVERGEYASGKKRGLHFPHEI